MSVVFQPRLRFIRIVVEIVGSLGEVIVLQIITIHINTVVDHHRRSAFTQYALLPYTSHVNIVTELHCIEQVPLIFENRIRDTKLSDKIISRRHSLWVCHWLFGLSLST